MKVDLFVLDRLAQSFDEHAVAPCAFAVHADGDAVVPEQAGEFGTLELAALVGVEDLGRPIFQQGFLYRLDAVERSSTDTLYLDITLSAGERFSQAVTGLHNVCVYPYERELDIGPADTERRLETRSAGLLSEGDRIEVAARAEGARLLLLAERPLREPVVQYGPFVMNTREEIEQASWDYQSGELAFGGAPT